MQLAATQRPHPPPVPPRPSRQVVAEALKRSPRPPCPTRQAPPPPNTKPWRSDQEQSNQQQVCPAVAGRTVVYESIKEPLSKETANENTGAGDHAARVADKDRRVARSGSERNDDEDDRRGNPRERRHRAANQEQRENSIEPTGILERRCSMPQEGAADRWTPARENSVECRESGKIEAPANSSESKVQNNDSGHRACDDPRNEDHARGAKESTDEASTEARNEMPIPCAKERVNAVSKSAAVPARSSVCSSDERRVPSSAESTIDRSRSHSEQGPDKAATKTDARPTPTQRLALARSGRDAAKKSATGTSPLVEGSSLNENAKSGSIVDRPTVVVIDEPERKTTSNDDDDNNDENDNIHRQDWLEAGVHYSSTQITLPGDDGDAVDGDPVNGLDRCENEKVGDLNFLR